MNDESELRDQTVTDAVEDLELQDEAADGVGGGDAVTTPRLTHPTQGDFSVGRNLK